MIDKTHWELRGPVRNMRSEHAEWDPPRHAWDRRFSQFVEFDDRGRITQLDQRGREQSIARTVTTYDEAGRPVRSQSRIVGGALGATTTWRYDERGRLVAMTVTGADGTVLRGEEWSYDDSGRKSRKTALGGREVDVYFVEESQCAYPAFGAVVLTTRYDEHGRAIEGEFVDANGEVVQRVVLERDAQGRIVAEEARLAGAVNLPRQPGMSDDDYRKFMAQIAYAWGSTRITYEYDSDGRRVSEVRQSGRLAEERTTCRYDEHGNLLEKREYSVDRQIGFDEDGTPRPAPDTIRVNQVRAAYVYDTRGNWTERIFSQRTSDDGEFQPGNAEWRTIEYW